MAQAPGEDGREQGAGAWGTVPCRQDVNGEEGAAPKGAQGREASPLEVSSQDWGAGEGQHRGGHSAAATGAGAGGGGRRSWPDTGSTGAVPGAGEDAASVT